MLGIPAPDQIFISVPFRNAEGSVTPNRVIAVGSPGNFTKILQTGDALPGTASIFSGNSGAEAPLSTRGGLPMVVATSEDGNTSHVGIYKNGAWQITKVIGATPPGATQGYTFSQPIISAANSDGAFVFRSTPNGNFSFDPSTLYIGQNGTIVRIIRDDLTQNFPQDSRQVLSSSIASLNANNVAVLSGKYRAVSGNSDQGGFVYRWSSASGFVTVIRRGDPLPELGTDVVFDATNRDPLINDVGQIFISAAIATRNPSTGVLSNRKSAYLYQANATAPIQKVLVSGETVPGSPTNFGNPFGSGNGNGPPSFQLNNSGQIGIFALVQGSSVVYGGTLPDLHFVLKSNWVDIAKVGTRSILFDSPSTFITNFTGLDGVSGEPDARLSEAGEFVFRGRYSSIGVGNFDTGTFKSSVANSVQVDPVAQTITFAAPTDRLISSSAFNPAATSSSGLAVTYEIVSGSATASGNLVTPGSIAGLVTIRATQSGNASFLAATPVEHSFRLAASASELAMDNYLAVANVPPADRLPNLDLDNDGLVNLLEYALGGNPLVSDPTKLPQIRIADGVLSFTFTRAQGDSLAYTVKTSVDLATDWTASGVNQGVPDVNGVITATLPLTAGGKGFLRLEVSLAP